MVLIHPFSKLNDFFLIKIKLRWPNKYKMSDIVTASSLHFQKQNIAEITLTWKMLLPTINGIKSGVTVSISPTLGIRVFFSRARAAKARQKTFSCDLTETRNLWHPGYVFPSSFFKMSIFFSLKIEFSDFSLNFFSDRFLTCDNPVIVQNEDK